MPDESTQDREKGYHRHVYKMQTLATYTEKPEYEFCPICNEYPKRLIALNKRKPDNA